MVIIIYSREEVISFTETKKKEEQEQEKCRNPYDESIQNDACIQNNNTSNLININSASKEKLMMLTGIGESKAKDIIEYREKNGGFQHESDSCPARKAR